MLQNKSESYIYIYREREMKLYGVNRWFTLNISNHTTYLREFIGETAKNETVG